SIFIIAKYLRAIKKIKEITRFKRCYLDFTTFVKEPKELTINLNWPFISKDALFILRLKKKIWN
ncbi:hypothetical protein, partial [Halanaerobium saccharolyticum]|uniref:hypothetical protein n=1 Tax=Halanaerobium saccharolyticum TaxID=43595 RepID=UPI001AB061D9